MKRVPQEVAFKGSGKTEQEKLLDKQKQLKERARATTAQQVESGDKDIVASERSRLKKKYSSKQYKNLKGNPFAKGK